MQSRSSLPSTIRLSCTPEEYFGVQEGLRLRVEAASQKYLSVHPGEAPWRVTSGLRSLQEQAREMAAMSPEQLLALYSKGGTPSYVQEMTAAENQPLTPERAYEILLNRKEGYVSKHLYGNAVDLAAKDMKDLTLAKKLLEEQGLAVKDEAAQGIPCMHVSSRE